MDNIKIQLPEHFLDEEERCRYKVSTDLKKIWAVELDLLKEVIRVCDKYGLKYYADGGTLLGCLRHKGYIPWDDDIDITMMRADYDKLCAVAAEEFKAPYFFQTTFTDVDCHFHHAKLRNSSTSAVTECDLERKFNQGIWIDILPLDNIPDDDDELAEYVKELTLIQSKLGSFKTYLFNYQPKRGKGVVPFLRHSLKRLYVKYIWSKLHTPESLCLEIDSLMKRYKDRPGKRIANVSMIWYVIPRNLYWRKEWFDGERFEDFEFLKMPVPTMGEKLMEMQYGDWHKMVMGMSCHQPKIFDTERPYTEYIK